MSITYPPEMLPSPDEGEVGVVIVMVSDWQTIETAPKDTQIILWGYSVHGQAAPGGPYKYYWRTIGRIDAWTGRGQAIDLLHPECDCIAAKIMEHPTHWMPLPEPPNADDRTAGPLNSPLS